MRPWYYFDDMLVEMSGICKVKKKKNRYFSAVFFLVVRLRQPYWRRVCNVLMPDKRQHGHESWDAPDNQSMLKFPCPCIHVWRCHTRYYLIILSDFLSRQISRKTENVSITRDVSGEGVQQALLKILEASPVLYHVKSMWRSALWKLLHISGCFFLMLIVY